MAEEKQIKNRILGIELIDWTKIKQLQPEGFKMEFDNQFIIDSIEMFGFVNSFYAWKNKGIYYSIDGKRRKNILQTVFKGRVPKLLPVTLIDAEDKKEAVKMLLKVFNEKQAKISPDSLEAWSEVQGIESDELESWNLNTGFEYDESEADEPEPEKQSEVVTDEKIILEYTANDCKIVKDELRRHGTTPESAVWSLLGLD